MQPTIIVKNWNDTLAKSALRFLKQRPETSLSLLSHLKLHGPYRTQDELSGDYQCLMHGGNVIAVFMINGFGRLFLQTDRAMDYSEIILQVISSEIKTLTGFVGDWELTQLFSSTLQLHFPTFQPTVCKKEILYRYDLNQLTPEADNPQVRFLNTDDYPAWHQLNLAFCQELNSAVFHFDSQRETRYQQEANRRHWWGLFLDQRLVAISTYLAQFENYAQIGGVFTDPSVRNQGLAKQLMKKIMQDSKNKHGIDHLTLFTHETNHVAQKVYETLGFKRIGYFDLTLCKF